MVSACGSEATPEGVGDTAVTPIDDVDRTCTTDQPTPGCGTTTERIRRRRWRSDHGRGVRSRPARCSSTRTSGAPSPIRHWSSVTAARWVPRRVGSSQCSGGCSAYGTDHADEFGTYGLIWHDAGDASVFISLTTDLDAHRAALAEIVEYPDELIVCQAALSGTANQALQAALVDELAGRFISIGQGVRVGRGPPARGRGATGRLNSPPGTATSSR